MGFSYDDISSKSMGLKARLTSWQVCGGMRNFITTVPGKYGVTDFGADFDYREISVACNIYPKHSFSSLVTTLDELSTWLDPMQGLKELVFDDVPDRYFMTVPGKYGVTDFGADFDYREINVACNIYPKHSFSALVSTLDELSTWLDPMQGLKELVFDDVPDRYFMARLNEKVDCERLIRFAGSFNLKFFCPDPFAYAITDENYLIESEGVFLS